MLTALINGMTEANEKLTLVLDDYHLIETQAIHHILAFILEHQPPFITSDHRHARRPPAAPWRDCARGEMSELRKDDLRFTTAEAAHFLNQMMQLGLTQEQVAMGTVYEGDSSPWENKMFLVDPQGEVVIEHYKYGNAPDEGFKPGDGVLQTVETPFGTLSALICNDTNHQEVVTQAGRNGTDILLSPALEFRGIVPMHAHMAAFRAIENGTTIVRQADNGLSVVIDPYGRTLAAMNHYTTDEHVTVAQVPADSSVFTLYPIISDLFAWLAIAGFVALIVYGIILWRREKRAAEVEEEETAVPAKA